jgi:hypothetical protein
MKLKYTIASAAVTLLSSGLLLGAAPAVAAPAAKTIPVYVGTAVVTAVQCAGSADAVGDVYEIAYRDKTSVVDFALFAANLGAKAFASVSSTQAKEITIEPTGTVAAGTVGYSGFAFTPLTSTDAKMTITMASSTSCTESYRALLTLTSVTS